MRALLVLLMGAGSTACASSPPRTIDPAIHRSEPAADAPAQLSGYGRLVGTWRCQAFEAQEDGSWLPKAESTWTFFYALGGKAIQDVWIPDAAGAPVGTNLRLYDPTTDTWTMVWASARQAMFDTFTARADEETIVMHGERAARDIFGAHHARITFHDIEPASFAWRYEAAATGSDGPWQPIQRLECRRGDRAAPG